MALIGMWFSIWIHLCVFGLVIGVTEREFGRTGSEKLTKSDDHVILGVQMVSVSLLLQIASVFRDRSSTLDDTRHCTSSVCVYHVQTKLHARLPSALSATSPTLGTLPEVVLSTA
jgi:hypothetical protein